MSLAGSHISCHEEELGWAGESLYSEVQGINGYGHRGGPSNGQNDGQTRKNITFPQLRWWQQRIHGGCRGGHAPLSPVKISHKKDGCKIEGGHIDFMFLTPSPPAAGSDAGWAVTMIIPLKV